MPYAICAFSSITAFRPAQTLRKRPSGLVTPAVPMCMAWDCALAVAAYAVDVSEMRLINDQAFVDKINSNPGLLWKVCFLPSGMLLCLSHAV